MIIGFTGTQTGMTLKQMNEVNSLFKELKLTVFHHGDCIGADSEAHDFAVLYFRLIKMIDSTVGKIVIHPPINNSKRAFCKALTIREPKEYLTRNKDIVNESDILIATPKEDTEQLRSGTWSTIRYARKMNKKIYIILPNGLLK